MESLSPYYEVRAELVDQLQKDLVGPGEPDETLLDRPITHYVSGILYPQSAEAIDASQDGDAIEDQDEGSFAEMPVALARVRYPSSMGLTFAVCLSFSRTLAVDVSAARYVQISTQAADDLGNIGLKRAGKREQWKRIPISRVGIAIDVSEAVNSKSIDLGDDLRLFYRIRAADSSNVTSVTLVLINKRQATEAGAQDADAVFQPVIRVQAENQSECFVERPGAGFVGDDEDVQVNRLLYRHAREFAIGHGCSVKWPATAVAPGCDFVPGERVASICTTFMPTHQIRLADHNNEVSSEVCNLNFLVHSSRESIIGGLRDFCATYGDWINTQQSVVASLSPQFAATANENLLSCRVTLTRMEEGIRLLESDLQVWQAFKFSNQAMLEQRIRSDRLKRGLNAPVYVSDGTEAWRPFQLAFILLCLAGVADRNSLDRDVVDLLWFPTGGGKTEAYLGLIAFCVFLRRLRNPKSGGVTAIMRYTLRLLTVQQFERASLLILCLENIRRQEAGSLGSDPISIGLWVGEDSTPNSIKTARDSLSRLAQGQPVEKSNPVQLRTCPWCGTALTHRNYSIRKVGASERLVISCKQDFCEYRDGLPIYVVDDDLYLARPTLVIATVDKFAGLPRYEKCAALFNIGPGRVGERQLPPELIIQDELHLISGPLGTIVGLYETAIDILCTDENGARPKVIASTATIRRAKRQVAGLFDRGVQQFPPPGLDARNSFFAIEAEPSEKGTRLYVGVMSPGNSQTTLLVRTYAALLQSVADLDSPPDAKDPYWTLLGYFNSLRVLGGARMQVQDDVNDRMKLLATRSGKQQRDIENRIELTSRESSGDIPKYLKQMAESCSAGDALDVILATNMISVGMDVERLGLMAVMGQPQATSEYIQATSRVGRKYPGLVVVIFNANRSRDRSHYEAFQAYHSALYRQVESSSVTPFSPRARDRALHAVLVALMRMLYSPLRANDHAKKAAESEEALSHIKQLILDRVDHIAPQELEPTRQQLDDLIDVWREFADRHSLSYRQSNSTADFLLKDPAKEGFDFESGFPTMFSMRDVDQGSSVYLVR